MGGEHSGKLHHTESNYRVFAEGHAPKPVMEKVRAACKKVESERRIKKWKISINMERKV